MDKKNFNESAIPEETDADFGNYFADIKVVGVGGGGVNAVNRMADYGLSGVQLIAMNTDAQQFVTVDADVKLDIGRKLTNGLGAGGNPDIGRQAAEESAEEIEENLRGADMVFITTGEGGGTGTGASPVVARIAKELGCLTVAVVTKPFAHEGRKKMKRALEGIEALREHVDCLVTIPNERLRHLGSKELTISNAFSLADENLLNNVRAVTEIITKTGFISVDFADVKSIMQNRGTAIVGIGQAKGEDRVIKATEQATSSPLLENTIDGATGVIFCVYGSEDTLTLDEFGQAAMMIEEQVDPDADIKDGLTYDDTLGDEVRVIVIATGFKDESPSSTNIPALTNALETGETPLASRASSLDSTTALPSVASSSMTSSAGSSAANVRPLDGDDAPDFVPSTFPRTGESANIAEALNTSGNLSRSVFNSDSSSPGIDSGDVANSGSLSTISGFSIPASSASNEMPAVNVSDDDDPLALPDFLND
jgi:cell division protein FtsZ